MGSFLALWIIGYGAVQALAPRLLGGVEPSGGTALIAGLCLAAIPGSMVLGFQAGLPVAPVLMGGLFLFAVVFALNSAVHSYLILAYSDHDKVAMNVGFYYMSNAGGRLMGTVLGGWLFQVYGLQGCLLAATGMIALTALFTMPLTNPGVSNRMRG